MSDNSQVDQGVADGSERPLRVRELIWAQKPPKQTFVKFNGEDELRTPPRKRSVPTVDPDEVPTEPLTRAEEIDAAVKSGAPRNLITRVLDLQDLVLELQERIAQLEGQVTDGG
jgi:hypothetical protein